MIVVTKNGVKIDIPKPVRPCPFCGNHVSLRFDEFDGYGNHDHRKDTEGAIIRCDNCEIHPEIKTYNYDYETSNDTEKTINDKRHKWADKVRRIVNIWNGDKDEQDEIY